MTPEQEKILTDAGAKRISLKRFFAISRDDGSFDEDDIVENPTADINGNPVNPHIWVGVGREVKIHHENSRAEVVRKIKNKEAPVEVSTKKLK
jgi:hypothetical protein